MVEEILSGEGVERRGVFATDDLGWRAGTRGHPGFQGILGRGGLALSGARAGGSWRIDAVGRDWFYRRHKQKERAARVRSRFEGSTGVEGISGVWEVSV